MKTILMTSLLVAISFAPLAAAAVTEGTSCSVSYGYS